MRPDANTAWFTFTVGADPHGGFGVYAFSGREAVCKPYEFSIELVSRSANVDVVSLLGTPALLSIADKSGGTRLAHGLIREMEQLHTANSFTHYRAVLVPRLWFLNQIRDHRIFQDLSVVEIIHQILKEQGFTAESFAFKLFYKYPPREYCVQYGETDVHFITRLCEEEGIYFYFEHAEDFHCLCFCDREGGPGIPGGADLRFHPGSGTLPDTAVISRLNLHVKVNSNAATYREWNFQRPNLDLTAQDSEPDREKAPAPPGMHLEHYQYPHLYDLRDPGTRYAKLQLARQLTFRQWITIESDVSRYLPSYVFHVNQHPRPEVNAGWWVCSVRHSGEQPGVLEHEAPSGRGLRYQSSVTAIPEKIRYIPKLAHGKNRVEGLQSAIVTGPAGEEVFCDEYGRVKVQFHWDRFGNHDEKTTCWVRVADSWAGTNFGFIQIPRIGQEVMVEFMEGDPDRPVITGRVYNAAEMPPWRLPEQKTLSGIQSREFRAARRNQLVLDDTEGQIQAQLSSDHGLSQLNLGYLTRVNHVYGRDDFRGEGFELRTDKWGILRATQGLYSTTHPRPNATSHQKDFSEGISGVTAAVSLHKDLCELSSKHNAHILTDDVMPVHSDLDAQKTEITGTGQKHSELTKPHVVVASASGIASTSVESHHMHAGAQAAITAEKNITLAAGQSLLGSFLEKICLFAHKAGVKIFAAMGKVQIQAQSDQIEMTADQSVRVVSLKDNVEIAAAKEILLTAGGSYIRISKNGIEQGTAGKWTVKAADHAMTGPKTHNEPMLDLPITGYTRDVEMVFSDMFGRGLQSEPLSLSNGSDFDLIESTDGTGKVSLKNIILSSLSVIQPTRK
jgi:type VI secretion system secreted protein VgrG